MSQGLKIIILLCVSAANLLAANSDEKSINLPLVNEGINIDGFLNETVYLNEKWNEGFYSISELGNHQDTRFLLFSDNQNLYFTAFVEEISPRYFTGSTRSDGVVTLYKMESNDCIGIALSVNDSRSEFIRYLVNPDGLLLKLEYSQDGFLHRTLKTEAQVAVKTESGVGWTVELAIPWLEINADPDFKDWLFQVSRNRRAYRGDESRRDRELSSWTETSSTEDVMMFASLLPYHSLDLARYNWRFEVLDRRILKRDQQFVLRETIMVENNTGLERGVFLRTQIGDDIVGEPQRLYSLSDGEREQIDVVYELGDKMPESKLKIRHELLLCSRNFKEFEEIVAVSADETHLEYTPFRLKFSVPGYRETIYETQNVEVVHGSLRIVDQRFATDNLRVLLFDSEGKEFSGQIEHVTDTLWELKVFNVKAMAFGNLRVVVTGGVDNQSWKYEHQIRKVPYQKDEIWIDEQGVMYRDGKPFPVYGFMYGHWGKLDVRRLPHFSFNIAGPLHISGQNPRGLMEIMDRLGEAGIYTGVSAPTGLVNGKKSISNRDSLTEEERRNYQKLARYFRDKQNLLYYYLYDEPEGRGNQGVSPRILKEIYSILADEDPYHPVLILNNSLQGVYEYQFGSDISNPDPYPGFLKGAGSSNSIARIGAYLDQIITDGESYRAKWITPQAFNWSYFNSTKGRRGPTATEMRTQQILGLIHGAVGVTWYPEYLVWDEIGVRNSLPYLQAEYQFLFPYLVKKRPEIISSSSAGSIAITGAPGEWIVMLANAQWEDVEMEVNDPRLLSVDQWVRLGGSDIIQGGSDALKVGLGPHESVILVSTAMVKPESLDWGAVEEREAAELVNAVKPGNLAHHSLGVLAVPINISTRAKSRAEYAIDGITDSRSLGMNYSGFKPGGGLELTFPEPVRASKLILIGSNIIAGDIEIEQVQGWHSVAQIEAVQGEADRIYDLGEFEFSRLRVVASRIESGDVIRIREVEVYE